jgi:Holliday junction resolvase RusA-like endonuclease
MAGSSIRLVIPMTPVSVNHYKKPRRGGFGYFVTKEAKAFKEAVALVARKRSVQADSYKVSILIALGKGQKGDLDNFSKLALDSLVDAGVIHSDAAICELFMQKTRDISNPRTEITITGIEDAKGAGL